MKQAFFRFYAELNDFLPPGRRAVEFTHPFEGSPAVKDLIEAAGVPHPEVDLILVDGESVDFSHRVRDGDRISVYPVFETFDITPLVRLRPRPLRETRFVLDTHLGRLARYLRLLGFDSLYRNDYDDADLARISVSERRILLTRDRGLLKRSQVTHGYCLRETDPRRQIAEVVRRFDLYRSIAAFQRCMRCNALLAPASQEAVREKVAPGILCWCDDFWVCEGCGRVYWKGSHYDRMRRLIDAVAGEAPLEGVGEGENA
jgi:uncharacterized protein with PIN domain